jgi:hypothetical protein
MLSSLGSNSHSNNPSRPTTPILLSLIQLLTSTTSSSNNNNNNNNRIGTVSDLPTMRRPIMGRGMASTDL